MRELVEDHKGVPHLGDMQLTSLVRSLKSDRLRLPQDRVTSKGHGLLFDLTGPAGMSPLPSVMRLGAHRRSTSQHALSGCSFDLGGRQRAQGEYCRCGL